MHIESVSMDEAASVMKAVSIASILERKGHHVWCLSPAATVYEAIALMDAKHVGALMVVTDGDLVGVVSERDYARKVILKGRSSTDTLVREIMTSPVIFVTPHYSVDECLRVMTHHHIRHLPVKEGRQVAGVVSIGDLVNTIISAQAETVHQLNSYIAGNYPG